MDQDKCLELLEEYHMLKRKIDLADSKSHPKDTYASEVNVEEEDIVRLQDLKEILGNKCQEFIPEDDLKEIKE